MTATKFGSVRCDWCGRISRNGIGAYRRPNGATGYISRAGKGDEDNGLDQCDECHEKLALAAQLESTQQEGAK